MRPLEPMASEPGGEALVQQAVESARRAGAQYADARLTRTVTHNYGFADNFPMREREEIGIGVRALVNGYWGFSACPDMEPEDVDELARAAVAQATVNARDAVTRT